MGTETVGTAVKRDSSYRQGEQRDSYHSDKGDRGQFAQGESGNAGHSGHRGNIGYKKQWAEGK